MASPAARLSQSVCRWWSNHLAGTARSVKRSSTVVQCRRYSDKSIEDPFASQSIDSDSSSGSPAGVPILDSVPSASTKPVPGKSAAQKKVFPPGDHWTSPRGVFKAIILGEVGQLPFQKVLKSGKSVTIFSVGTGGMFNNRKRFKSESSEEFDQRSNTQWHRVAVYVDRVAALVRQHVKVGSQVYLEGNMESRIFNDPNSSTVKRIREIAIRANGRVVFMEPPQANSSPQPVVKRPTEETLPKSATDSPSDPSVSA